MKLLRSERPGISFFAKVVQLLALICGTGLMFPEKIVVFIAQSGLKLYDFNIGPFHLISTPPDGRDFLRGP